MVGSLPLNCGHDRIESFKWCTANFQSKTCLTVELKRDNFDEYTIIIKTH